MATPVTDPALLARLEGKPVSDPATLARLEAPPPGVKAAPPVTPADAQDISTALGRGALAGAGWGFEPQLAGAGAAIGLSGEGFVPTLLKTGSPTEAWKAGGKAYDDVSTYEREHNKAARDQRPVAYGAAELAGGLPGAVASASGPGMLARVTGAGVYGGVNAAGRSEAPDFEGQLRDSLIGAGLGAGGQYVLGEVLAPWLGNKLTTRARDKYLLDAGVTRGQLRSIARKAGDAGVYESNLDDMARLAKENGVRGPHSWDKAGAALDEAKGNIGGFYDQASRPGVAGLEPTDILGAQLASQSRVASAAGAGKQASIDSEVDYLLQKYLKGELSPAEAHKWALDLRSKVFPNGGMTPESIDAQSMMRFRQELVEKMRANALAANAAGGGGAVTPDAFQRSITDYGALTELDKLTRQGLTRETSGHGLFSFLNRHGPEAGMAAGAGALHSLAPALDAIGATGLVEAAVPALAVTAATKFVHDSPRLLEAGARMTPALSPVFRDIIGNHTPSFSGIVGQVQAARDFAAGKKSTSYTPPTH